MGKVFEFAGEKFSKPQVLVQGCQSEDYPKQFGVELQPDRGTIDLGKMMSSDLEQVIDVVRSAGCLVLRDAVFGNHERLLETIKPAKKKEPSPWHVDESSPNLRVSVFKTGDILNPRSASTYVAPTDITLNRMTERALLRAGQSSTHGFGSWCAFFGNKLDRLHPNTGAQLAFMHHVYDDLDSKDFLTELGIDLFRDQKFSRSYYEHSWTKKPDSLLLVYNPAVDAPAYSSVMHGKFVQEHTKVRGKNIVARDII